MALGKKSGACSVWVTCLLCDTCWLRSIVASVYLLALGQILVGPGVLVALCISDSEVLVSWILLVLWYSFTVLYMLIMWYVLIVCCQSTVWHMFTVWYLLTICHFLFSFYKVSELTCIREIGGRSTRVKHSVQQQSYLLTRFVFLLKGLHSQCPWSLME